MGKLLSHPLTIIIFTLVCALFIYSLQKSSQKTVASRDTTTTLQNEVQELSKTVTSLQEKKEFVNSDEYTEKLIRNELLMQKEGEYIIKVVLPPESETPPPADSTPLSPREQWQQLLF